MLTIHQAFCPICYRRWSLLLSICSLLVFVGTSNAQSTGNAQSDEPSSVRHNRVTALDLDLPNGVDFSVQKNVLTFHVPASIRKFEIPNLFAPIANLEMSGSTTAASVSPKIVPLTTTWEIEIPQDANGDKQDGCEVQLELDASPKTLDHAPIAFPSADQTLRIPAHFAKTFGEKLRYEPQPWKNTVGYWTVVNDYAVFAIQVNQPGTYNVGVLQGCGKDNGGSQVVLQWFPISASDRAFYDMNEAESQLNGTKPVASLEFEAIETGHFQDFRWRDVGQVTLPAAGRYLLKLGATKIENVAVMDTREICLTILPK